VISSGIAYILLVVAQQDAKPTPAAILLSLESVFAVFWGWLLIKEVLTPRAILAVS
jgi:drug/metabolite transporter (DMT)-like permease